MVSLRSSRRGPFITAATVRAAPAPVLAALIALGLSAPVLGQGQGAAELAPRLSLPLDCRPAVDCWIASHVDLDPGRGFADYACGRLGYDGHKGTDIAIRDLGAMAEGMAVLAAAPGAGPSRGANAATASPSNMGWDGPPSTATCEGAASMW